jgi:hypothetical protein
MCPARHLAVATGDNKAIQASTHLAFLTWSIFLSCRLIAVVIDALLSTNLVYAQVPPTLKRLPNTHP